MTRYRADLRQQQVEKALINLGGNVHTLGEWAIGLKKPFADAQALIGSLTVNGQSVVTSGTYERYFEQDGKRWHHILDPRSGYPLDNELESVTIISADSLDGDIWTTLIYGLGVEKGCAALRQHDSLVLMKVYGRFARIKALLAQAGLLDAALMMSEATLPGEQCWRHLRDVSDDQPLPYFSTILVNKQWEYAE